MQTQVNCPGCSVNIKTKPEWAGRRVKCPKCQASIPIPRNDTNEVDDANSPTTPRWLICGAVGLIAMAVGIAGGFIFGHGQGRSDDKKELTEANSIALSLTSKLQASDAEVAKLHSERDTLKSEVIAITQDRDVKLVAAKQKEEAANTKANLAEQRLAGIAAAEMVSVEKRRDEERQKAEAWKKIETVQISTVKEALMVHENPKDFVGKKIIISKDIVFIVGNDFERNAETNGYLFTWKCGATASGAERMGSDILVGNKMHYWCDTDFGLLAKETLKAEYRGDKIIYNQMALVLTVTKFKHNKYGRDVEYYVAVLAAGSSK